MNTNLERRLPGALFALVVVAAASFALVYSKDDAATASKPAVTSGVAKKTSAVVATEVYAGKENSAQPIKTASILIPSGTSLEAKMVTHVSSRTAVVGDEISAVTTENLVINGKTLIPAGTTMQGRVVAVRPAAETKSKAVLRVAFSKVGAIQTNLSLLTPDLEERAKNAAAAADVALVAGGAVAGAVIGHQIDGKKGKKVGAVTGAVIGGVTAANLGANVQLKAGEAITVVFQEPVAI